MWEEDDASAVVAVFDCEEVRRGRPNTTDSARREHPKFCLSLVVVIV